ncbi:hypothetical protein EYF80_020122 [Liparis tanakae]|uniref:Uncharacterized protein n=1 Tax=Liparis tanakae TaxID=230148 RepID=A0A4Z2HXI4_9TELE|nr:hypothetical protein EYF80_020122 [Liparis tanakae]
MKGLHSLSQRVLGQLTVTTGRGNLHSASSVIKALPRIISWHSNTSDVSVSGCISSIAVHSNRLQFGCSSAWKVKASLALAMAELRPSPAFAASRADRFNKMQSSAVAPWERPFDRSGSWRNEPANTMGPG